MNRARIPLPVVNLVNIAQEHLNALLTEGPGFGKTTALAVATLAMLASLGSVYASAPTNVAADNFAERLDLISQRVAARRNKGKSAGDKKRARSALVLRGYNNERLTVTAKTVQ
ncbi:hypothetical protein ACHAPX_003915 [Trichoderma viride]